MPITNKPKRESKKQPKVIDKTLTASKVESISSRNSDNFKV